MRRIPGIVLVFLVIAGVQAGEAQSGRPQSSLTATPQRDLTFGTVLPGIPTEVRAEDNRRAGRFEIRGPTNASIRVDLLLPQVMTSAGGDEIPLVFGPGDGTASANRGRGRALVFNPWEPLIAVLGRNGRLYVRLGGTAQPTRIQTAGSYSGTISLTVYNLGT